MIDFNYSNPAKIIFGRNAEKHVGQEIAGCARKVLIVVGGDFIYKTGLYGQVTSSFEELGLSFLDFDRVTSNPKMSGIEEGIRVAREAGVDFVLAIGGGSAIDTAKCIAAGVKAKKPLWHYFENFTDFITDALPVGVILTLPASGSEVSHVAVATHDESGQKRSLFSPLLIPRFACMNPELGATLPAEQLAYGSFDAFSHLVEMYFTKAESTLVTDCVLEGAMRSLVLIAERLALGERSYDLMAELFLAANLANNGILSVGRGAGDWGSHNIGHELSSAYNLPHGLSLALVMPAWMRLISRRDPGTIAQLLGRVFLGWQMTEPASEEDEQELIERGLEAFAVFIERLKLPARLGDAGVPENALPALAASALDGRQGIGMCYELSEEDVRTILELAY